MTTWRAPVSLHENDIFCVSPNVLDLSPGILYVASVPAYNNINTSFIRLMEKNERVLNSWIGRKHINYKDLEMYDIPCSRVNKVDYFFLWLMAYVVFF